MLYLFVTFPIVSDAVLGSKDLVFNVPFNNSTSPPTIIFLETASPPNVLTDPFSKLVASSVELLKIVPVNSRFPKMSNASVGD